MKSHEIGRIQGAEAELLIIGAGGAGLAAAVTAAQKGARKVLVLEKRGVTGGNTTMSSGLFAAESPAQKRDAIDARCEHFFKILMEFSHWKANPNIVRTFINRSADTIRWLEGMGLFFRALPMYPNQIPTWHQAEGGKGAQVVKVLTEKCHELRVDIILNVSAKKILRDDSGKVKGVLAESGDKEFRVYSKKVIVATGGYGGNRELLRKYSPAFRENMLCDGLLHTGDGLIMAMEAGADTEGLGLLLMSGPQIPGSINLYWGDPPDVKESPLMALALEPNTVWVNKRGERIADETVGYNHYTSANTVNRQPDNICYTLLDHGIVKAMESDGLVIGLGKYRPEMRHKMPGLAKALMEQTKGLMTVEQVDPEICNGCGICVNACSVGAVTLDTVADDRNEFSPCRLACPASVDMRRYVYLLRQGKIEEAYEVLREFLPFPAITGRVCPHFCETECARNEVDDSVNIHSLERFVADSLLNERANPVPIKHKKKTAVIGSGPAGLSCAYFLIRMGYPVTVFESNSLPGGMLRTGIPEYRLPRDILDKQINYIKEMGVDLKTKVTVGRDITFEALREDYDAVFLAPGNQLSKRMEVDGAERDGVFWGLDFLRSVNSGKKPEVKGKEVVVIGGGSVAIDAALTALRLDAEQVRLVCLESGEEIPAYKEGLDQAISEGIVIHEGWGPERITGGGSRVTGIELVRCTKVYDDDGSLNPSFDMNVTKSLKTDMVVLAIGQSPDLSLTPVGIMTTRQNTIQADPVTLQTNISGVFAGGDVIGGSLSVVKAIADGKRASISIDRYFRGKDLKKGRGIEPKRVKVPPKEGIPEVARHRTPIIPPDERSGNFEEIKAGFDEITAAAEAGRCMTCGSRARIHYVEECRMCKSCEMSCPMHAIYPAPVRRIEPHVRISDSWDEIAKWMGADPASLKQTIDEYNADCDRGYDSKFFKDRKYMVPLRQPPYYAIKSNSDYLDTIGGIKINERMEVIDKHGNPIPGLYAAGVVAGGWQGDTYCVILSGAASGFAINSGRIAAENAMEESWSS